MQSANVIIGYTYANTTDTDYQQLIQTIM